MSLPAYAKINLGLEILGRRPDGFHEIVSVTQLISLADTVTVTPSASLSVSMSPPLVDPSDNLVGRAAQLLADDRRRVPGAAIHVEKQIPLAAGLGGGSSDAAATLRLLDRLWESPLGLKQLSRFAAQLGSDVSLFLHHGTCLIRGRGEIVEPISAVQPFWLVLICPGGAPVDKTRALYGALTPADFGSGARTLHLADRIIDRHPLDDRLLVNSFDRAADRVYPDFAPLRSRLQDALGRPVHLTGAGPTLFAICPDRRTAERAARSVQRLEFSTYVARSVARRPRIREHSESVAPADRSEE